MLIYVKHGKAVFYGVLRNVTESCGSVFYGVIYFYYFYTVFTVLRTFLDSIKLFTVCAYLPRTNLTALKPH